MNHELRNVDAFERRIRIIETQLERSLAWIDQAEVRLKEIENRMFDIKERLRG